MNVVQMCLTVGQWTLDRVSDIEEMKNSRVSQ